MLHHMQNRRARRSQPVYYIFLLHPSVKASALSKFFSTTTSGLLNRCHWSRTAFATLLIGRAGPPSGKLSKEESFVSLPLSSADALSHKETACVVFPAEPVTSTRHVARNASRFLVSEFLFLIRFIAACASVKASDKLVSSGDLTFPDRRRLLDDAIANWKSKTHKNATLQKPGPRLRLLNDARAPTQ